MRKKTPRLDLARKMPEVLTVPCGVDLPVLAEQVVAPPPCDTEAVTVGWKGAVSKLSGKRAARQVEITGKQALVDERVIRPNEHVFERDW